MEDKMLWYYEIADGGRTVHVTVYGNGSFIGNCNFPLSLFRAFMQYADHAEQKGLPSLISFQEGTPEGHG